MNKFPGAQLVQPLDLRAEDVPETVEWSRAVAREHGKETLAWWLGPANDHLGEALEALGIANADTPGFEAVENALVLVEPPAGGPVDGVEVRVVETLEDYVDAVQVPTEAFGLPRRSPDENRADYDLMLSDDNGRFFIGVVDGEVVGAAFCAFADVGLNLFGGSVLPEARGRGVYRALLRARWEFAVDRGTPALTVQAGRMSLPICEREGFRPVGYARVFVDHVTQATVHRRDAGSIPAREAQDARRPAARRAFG
jgi:GNAT superfamily N-acetyltransferase